MSVELIKPALDSTNDLLDTIRVGLLWHGSKPMAYARRSPRPRGQNTSNWNRLVLVSVKYSVGGQIESKMIVLASPDSRQSKS